MAIFALVDCNNFFASCERVFNPKLEGQPIVVLSNNDGCIIARSNEAKQLGIPMGGAFQTYRTLCQNHGVHVFSSNFQLYGNMSNRVMAILQQLVPDMEVYSIDEAFLCLDGIDSNELLEYVEDIRVKIKKWTGLSVSIGIGPSKTLAKLANQVAKKCSTTGIFSLMEPKVQDEVLSKVKVEEIWGINSRWGTRFREYGINTALQLRDSDSPMIRKYFSVIGQRIVLELQGISCLPLGARASTRKSIIASRSFGKRVTNVDKIAEALSNYVASACARLRRQRSRTQSIHIYLKTNRFCLNEQQHHQGMSIGFSLPTSDTRVINKAAIGCLKSLYKPGFYYHKAGIILLELVAEDSAQSDLFLPTDSNKSDKLMATLDGINIRMGKNAVFLASQGTTRDWQMRCDRRSQRYTTNWDELLKVQCDW